MLLPKGKGLYIWQYYKYTPEQIKADVQAMGLGHVVFKVADGIYKFGIDYQAQLKACVEAVKSLGNVQVWGYGYSYAANSVKEAQVLAQQVIELDLVGAVIDGEGYYRPDAPGPGPATTYAGTLRAALPNHPIGLSSYRRPVTMQPDFPWSELKPHIDFVYPQVYWVGAHNPVTQLAQSINEYNQIYPEIPYIPVGSAYGAVLKDGTWWAPTAGELENFMFDAREKGLAGVSFWKYESVVADPTYFAAVAAFDWPIKPTPEPEPEPGPSKEEILAALSELYDQAHKLAENIDYLAAWVENGDIVPDPEPPTPDPEPEPTPDPEPVGIPFKITADKTNLRVLDYYKETGVPVMKIYPSDTSDPSDRIQRFEGDIIHIVTPAITADGGVRYFKVTDVQGRSGETLYVLKDDGVQQL